MSSANERQVGGDHYQRVPGEQHCRTCGQGFKVRRGKKEVFCSEECRNARGFQPQLFWSKVDQETGSAYSNLGKCWIWMPGGGLNGYGYYNNKRVHRISYEEHIGLIPRGKLVLHRCDNPICVNPSHLFLGTNKDNQDDMMEKGRGRKATGPGSTRLHRWGKLTPEEAELLRELRKQGWTYPQLGKRFGIHSESARLIVKGRYHNHGS